MTEEAFLLLTTLLYQILMICCNFASDLYLIFSLISSFFKVTSDIVEIPRVPLPSVLSSSRSNHFLKCQCFYFLVMFLFLYTKNEQKVQFSSVA